MTVIKATAIYHDGHNYQSDYIGTPDGVRKSFREDMELKTAKWARLFDANTGEELDTFGIDAEGF
ncbi:hypothetical protein [Vibrio crassostreae]|uniref:hypothetical protein n=1 Tax=Vibrio crassostreae TaxID=246167 RepID=UPI001B3050CE|nr:hypothetical protein [Vibrio crassostreae]